MVTSPGIRALMAPGWVRDPLWTRAQRVPSLDLRFAANRSLMDHASGAQLVTFTRASSATVIGPTGLIETAATDVPRFQHDPTTGQCLGLLVEEQRINLLLNSATLSTQSVTVAATAYTLSFYGTGTVTLSGTSTAGPLVGTGANARVSLTFTPTAGTLTLTVSGSVTNANLEAGSFATSWIPTTGTSATRSADVAQITGSNLSRWYNTAAGTLFADVTVLSSSKTQQVISFNDGTLNNRLELRVVGSADQVRTDCVVGGVTKFANQALSLVGQRRLAALAAQANDFRMQAGPSGFGPASDSLPTVDRLFINYANFAGGEINGTVSRLTYWPARLSNATLQALTR